MAAAAEEGAGLWLAQYDEKGALLEIRQAEEAAGQVLLFPLSGARQVLLLCLDGQWTPRAEAVRVSLDGVADR